MATDEEKKENLLRMTKLVILGLGAGIWDIIGDGVMGLSRSIGNQLLPVLEKEMGLEIAGETPEDVLQEVGRLLVDEFGYAQDIDVTREGDTITVKVDRCVICPRVVDKLKEHGVEQPFFLCPLACIGGAALSKMGAKALLKVEREEGPYSVIHFELA